MEPGEMELPYNQPWKVQIPIECHGCQHSLLQMAHPCGLLTAGVFHLFFFNFIFYFQTPSERRTRAISIINL